MRLRDKLAEAEEIIRSAVDTFGRVDVLCNNAVFTSPPNYLHPQEKLIKI